MLLLHVPDVFAIVPASPVQPQANSSALMLTSLHNTTFFLILTEMIAERSLRAG